MSRMKILKNIWASELFWNIRPRGNCWDSPPELVEAPSALPEEEEENEKENECE